MNHKIGLVEALCGFQFMLKHLDGRQIVVKYPPGKVIEPGNAPATPLVQHRLTSPPEVMEVTDININVSCRLGEGGARRRHATVPEPLREGRSLRQV